MAKAKVRLTFEGDSKPPTEFGAEAEFSGPRSQEGEEYVAQRLHAELQNEAHWERYLDALPEMPSFASPITQSFSMSEKATSGHDDRINARAMWFEISNLLLRVRSLFARSRAYHEAEQNVPRQEAAFNARVNIHLTKMDNFDLGIVLLAKVADMVARLIFERLGASLIKNVDFTDPEWDRHVSLGNVRQAFQNRAANSYLAGLPDSEYNAVLEILRDLTQPDFVVRLWNYRIRLMHRVTPSVDYPGLYSQLQNRAWDPIGDKGTGEQKGWTRGIGGHSHADHSYLSLYDDATRTLGHFITRLKLLAAIARFGPEAKRA